MASDLMKKIHFVKISLLGYNNQGDIFCSPLPFYADYFMNYNVIQHSMDAINYYEIAKDDVVIVGGGGLLDFKSKYNIDLNKLNAVCDNVILWGAGTNADYDMSKGTVRHIEPHVNLDDFALYGIRDFNYAGLNYTPCASSANPLLKEVYASEPGEKIGTMFYTKKYITDRYDNLSHYHNLGAVLNFISRFDTIVTQSYHCALWATLSNRKVIMFDEARLCSKFNHLRYKPTFAAFSEGYSRIEELRDAAKNYPHALEESVTDANEFFGKVRGIVEHAIPAPSNNYSMFYHTHKMGEIIQSNASLKAENGRLAKRLDDLEQRVSTFAPKPQPPTSPTSTARRVSD